MALGRQAVESGLLSQANVIRARASRRGRSRASVGLALAHSSRVIAHASAHVSARTEQAITRVAQAREDVPMFVESPVKRGAVDRDIGMRGVDTLHTFRSGDQA